MTYPFCYLGPFLFKPTVSCPVRPSQMMDPPAKQHNKRRRHRKEALCPDCGTTFKSRNRLVKHASECPKAQTDGVIETPRAMISTPPIQEPGNPPNLARGLSSQLASAIASPTTLPGSALPRLEPIPPLKLTPLPAFSLASMPSPTDACPNDERSDQYPDLSISEELAELPPL